MLAGICVDGRTEQRVIDGGSMTAIRYMDNIVDPILKQFTGSISDNFVLMHDNERAHVARVVQGYSPVWFTISWEIPVKS